MIKSKALLGLAMLCATQIFGQFEKPREIDFEISDPYRVIDADSKHYFYEDGEVYAIKIDRKKTIIQRFDGNTLKELSRKELDMPKSYALETVTEFGGRFLMFYSIWDRDRESEQLFYREIDFKTASWKGAEKRIIATRGKIAGPSISTSAVAGGMFTAISFGTTDKFDFYYSSDDTKMLVQYRKVPRVKSDAKNHDDIGIFVFNSNMEELHGGEERMPYTEKKMNNIDYAVDKDGNAYILATVFEDNSTRTKSRDGDPNYHIELLKKTPGSKKMEISEIRLEDKFITKMGLYESSENLLVCAGFYNKTNSSGSAEGAFFAKIDKAGELYDTQSYAIPLEILNQYESKRTRKKNEKKDDKGKAEFQELVLRKMVFMADGGIIIIGEQYFIQEHTTYTNGRSSTYYTYHYNDILVTKIDPAGDLAWMRKLPKTQYGRAGRGSMSFTHHYGEGYHYFMFLDDERNRNLPFDETPEVYSDGKEGVLSAFIVDDTRGEVSKEDILDMRDAKGVKLYQFAPTKIMKTAENEFVFEAYKKKKEDVLVKISLKEG